MAATVATQAVARSDQHAVIDVCIKRHAGGCAVSATASGLERGRRQRHQTSRRALALHSSNAATGATLLHC